MNSRGKKSSQKKFGDGRATAKQGFVHSIQPRTDFWKVWGLLFEGMGDQEPGRHTVACSARAPNQPLPSSH